MKIKRNNFCKTAYHAHYLYTVDIIQQLLLLHITDKFVKSYITKFFIVLRYPKPRMFVLETVYGVKWLLCALAVTTYSLFLALVEGRAPFF